MGRLYFTNAAAPYTPPVANTGDYKGAWDGAFTGANALATTAQGVVAEIGQVTSTIADYDYCLRRFTAILGTGGRFGNTAQYRTLARESSGLANAVLHMHLAVHQGQSNILRGNLVTNHVGSGEFVVSTTTRTGRLTEPLQTSPVDVVAGDLLVCELGFRSNAGSTAYTAAVEYGGSGSYIDLPGLNGLNVIDLAASTSRVPEFRSTSTSTTPGAGYTPTSQYVPVPVGAEAKDVMVAMMFVTSPDDPITPPLGFVEAPNSPITLTGSHSHRVFWKRLDAADTGTYEFTALSTSTTGLIVSRFSKCITSGVPFEALSSAAAASRGTLGTVSPAVSGTTTGPDRLWLFQPMNYATSTWATYTQSHAEAVDDAIGQAMSVKAQAVAGASGSVTATASVSEKMTAWLGALIGEPAGQPDGSGGQFFPFFTEG